MITYLLDSVLGFSMMTWAAPICLPTVSQIAGPRKVASYIFKIATIGPTDRRTLQEFAHDENEPESAIAQRYSGSVDMYCGNHFVQAQVVLKNDVLLAPAHVLYDDDDCDKPREVESCKVYRMERGKIVTYEVGKAVAKGYACPDKSTVNDQNDWAILRLKKPLPSSIKPYKIRTAPCATVDEPADVVFVAKSTDFRREKTMLETPRHYGRCKLMKGNCSVALSVMETDCDMAKGASGGGLFVGGKQPELIGINSAHYKSCPGSEADQTGAFFPGCWSAAAAPIAGKLLETLQNLTM